MLPIKPLNPVCEKSMSVTGDPAFLQYFISSNGLLIQRVEEIRVLPCQGLMLPPFNSLWVTKNTTVNSKTNTRSTSQIADWLFSVFFQFWNMRVCAHCNSTFASSVKAHPEQFPHRIVHPTIKQSTLLW